MKEIEKAQMGIITVLALMLVSIKRRLPTRRLSSGITTLALAGVVLLVAAGSASAVNVITSCGNVGAGDFVLGAHLTCPADQACLVITADDVTIDGYNESDDIFYTITGNVSTSNCVMGLSGGCGEAMPSRHSAVDIRGADVFNPRENVTVKNLTIHEFCTGIGIKDAKNITVTGCKISDSGLPYGDTNAASTFGIHLAGTQYCDITKNEVYGTNGTICSCGGGGNGIFTFGGETYGWQGDDNNFTCNNLHHNAKAGFHTKKQCANNIVSYNNVTDNGAGGIVLRCAATDSTTIEYNYVADNLGAGIYFRADGNTLRYNTVINNKDGSQWTVCGASAAVYAVCDRGVGVEVQSGAINAQIYDNHICGNAHLDIEDNSGTLTGDDNDCSSISGYGGDVGASGQCDYDCTSTEVAYFDFDGDGYYSKDPVNCQCNGAGASACCNPGLFDPVHLSVLYAAGICVNDAFTHDDPNDCDNTIQGDARPDLVIQDLNVAWLDSGANETHYEVSYKVCNIGGGPSVASVARTTIDSVAQDDQSIAALAKNTCTAVITVGPFEMDPDSDAIEVCADATDTNPNEINELNNCSSVTQGARKPDLIITAKYETWKDKPNREYWINYTVCNIGNATAPASKTRVDVNGVNPDPIGALAPGACTGDIRVAAMQTMTGDDDTIKLRADGDNSGVGRIDEWDETNNNRTNTFTYVSMINVSISPCQASIGPYSTNRTSVFIILENIENYGSGTIDLEFDESVVEVDTITATGCDSDTVTPNRVGQGHWRITAVSGGGESNYVKFANVTFKPKGLPPQCSDLDLTVVTLYDIDFNKLHINPGTSTKTCEICIFELDAPGVTNPDAEPQVILNTNGRARVPGSDISDLSVFVTDATSVDSVTINLTQILLGAGNATVSMALKSGDNTAGTWNKSTIADRNLGVDLTHHLYVNATDYHGNSNTGQYIELTVLRRGDVVRDNAINSADYLYIMMYTVDLVPAPDEFVAGVVPDDSWDGVDAGDALYIAMHTVNLVPAP